MTKREQIRQRYQKIDQEYKQDQAFGRLCRPGLISSDIFNRYYYWKNPIVKRLRKIFGLKYWQRMKLSELEGLMDMLEEDWKTVQAQIKIHGGVKND